MAADSDGFSIPCANWDGGSDMKDISRKEALKMATEILLKAERERELLDERLFSKKAEIFSLLDGFKYKK